MEEPVDGRGAVVYFYASGDESEISGLYHRSSPPTVKPESRHLASRLAHVNENVRLLLNENRCDFAQVFISACSRQCREKVGTLAASCPTVVLAEVAPELIDRDGKASDAALAFLRAVAADIQDARHQYPVISFVLIPNTTLALASVTPSTRSEYLAAGAVSVLGSPIGRSDSKSLVARVVEKTLPSARQLATDMPDWLLESIRNLTTPSSSAYPLDEIIPLDRRIVVERVVGLWKFPAHDLDMDELTYAALIMLEHILRHPELEPYRIARSELIAFLLTTRRQYKHECEVQYHNWRHAVDVAQSLYFFMLSTGLCPPSLPEQQHPRPPQKLDSLLSPFDALLLVVSGIGHDVGHPGVNNAFLVNTNHHLAQMYNDKSVLENFHCAAYSQILRRHWPSLHALPHFRATMISVILATDMQRHFEYMEYLKQLKEKLASADTEPTQWAENERDQTREHLMALLIKAADISNVARPFEVSSSWSWILMHEFARQGDLEKEMDIPTCLFGGPPNISDALAAAQGQKGFMTYFVHPLFRGLAELMPCTASCVNELDLNKDLWDRRILDEQQRREKNEKSPSPGTLNPVDENKASEPPTLQKCESEPDEIRIPVPHTPPSQVKRLQATDIDESPSRQPASEPRLQFSLNHLHSEKRSSSPYRAIAGASSRRSSKEAALNHLHELSMVATTTLNTGSRRGSADASWQIHQSYPDSRRGSKDESLTAIVVTSPGNPAPAHSSAPSARSSSNMAPAKSHSSGKWQPPASSGGPKPPVGGGAAGGRNSIPSSRSYTTSSATMTDQQSPSTQPSSIAPTDDDPMVLTSSSNTNPAQRPATSGDAFFPRGNWSTEFDDDSTAGGLPLSMSDEGTIPSVPQTPRSARTGKTDSPSFFHRVTGVDSDERPRSTRGHYDGAHRVLRESRSLTRLRGLKFWKKRKDVVVDSGDLQVPGRSSE